MKRVPKVVEILGLYRWAKGNPQEHDQKQYARRSKVPAVTCGTAYCLAGKAVERAGEPLHWMTTEHSRIEWAAYCDLPGGKLGDEIGVRAAELLGLTARQALNLFDPENGLADIRKWIWAFTGIDPETPAVCDWADDHEPHAGGPWEVGGLPVLVRCCTGVTGA